MSKFVLLNLITGEVGEDDIITEYMAVNLDSIIYFTEHTDGGMVVEMKGGAKYRVTGTVEDIRLLLGDQLLTWEVV